MQACAYIIKQSWVYLYQRLLAVWGVVLIGLITRSAEHGVSAAAGPFAQRDGARWTSHIVIQPHTVQFVFHFEVVGKTVHFLHSEGLVVDEQLSHVTVQKVATRTPGFIKHPNAKLVDELKGVFALDQQGRLGEA